MGSSTWTLCTIQNQLHSKVWRLWNPCLDLSKMIQISKTSLRKENVIFCTLMYLLIKGWEMPHTMRVPIECHAYVKHTFTHSRTHIQCENILREISVCCLGRSHGPDRFRGEKGDPSLHAFVTGTRTNGADTEVCTHLPYNGEKHPDRRVKMQDIFNENKLSVTDFRSTLGKYL